MEQLKLLASALLLGLVMTGCNVKDPIYEGSLTEHPDHGKITLTADWSQRGTGVEIPVAYWVRLGDYTETFTDAVNAPDELFDPGNYTLHSWNAAEGITLSGTTATVSPVSRAATINNMPGWLFTCAMDVVIEPDKVHPLTAVMTQQVGQLTLVIEPTGGPTDRIETITGTLSGVAGTLDFSTGIHSAPSEVALTFTKITTGEDAGKWSATVRLLGVTGQQQKLSGTIKFAGGNPVDMPLESDLSYDLLTFNDNKREAVSLKGEAIALPVEPGFTGIINGWEKQTGSGIAN